MRLLLLSLLPAFALFGQPPVPVFLMGTVTAVAGDRLTVQSGPITTAFYEDRDSRIWRGTTTNSFSRLQPGDSVWIRYRDSAGRHVVLELYANMTHVWGRITGIGTGNFEVEQNFNADPQSAYRHQFRQVAFSADTKFEESAPEDVRVGRFVDIIGLETASEVVASRVTIYEGSRPVRMDPAAPVRLPNGSVRPSK